MDALGTNFLPFLYLQERNCIISALWLLHTHERADIQPCLLLPNSPNVDSFREKVAIQDSVTQLKGQGSSHCPSRAAN